MASLKEINHYKLFTLIDQLFTNIDNIPSVEAAAQLLTQSMCETFKTDSKSDIVLSRIFHSFEYQALPVDIQEVAKRVVGNTPSDNSIFLSLIGTYGDETAWRSRFMSQGHQAIPITQESIKKIPMMTRLFQQMGFDLGILLGEGSPGIDVSGVERSYSVFYVKDAWGSSYIPAQDFVRKYSVKSVVGSGIELPTNDVSIYIGFTRLYLDELITASIAPLMSLFWQKIFPLIEKGFFS
jgi:hypothetical protein